MRASDVRRFASAGVAAVFSLASLVACNLLINTESTQCERDEDCNVLFAGQGLVCEQSSCIKKAAVADSGPGGGDADAAATPAECSTNATCMDLEATRSGGSAICVKGTCQPIKLEGKCLPQVLPVNLPGNRSAGDLLRDENVVVLGGFVSFKNGLQDPVARAYNLALKEIYNYGGLPDGPGGKSRPVVMVVCDSDVGNVEQGVAHLVALNVPAVLALFSPNDMLSFVTKSFAPNGIFTMNPNDAPVSLKYRQVSQLAWHLLGTAEDVALTYRPLMALVEDEVRSLKGLSPTTPIKVALVATTYPTDQSIADTIASGPTAGLDEDGGLPRNISGAIAFNDGGVQDGGGAVVRKSTVLNKSEGNFAYFPQLPSTDLGGNPNYAQMVADLDTFKPDVVIGVTGRTEIEKLAEPFEDRLAQKAQDAGATASFPIWLLSVGNHNAPSLLQYLANDKNQGHTPKRNRFFGVQYAGSSEPQHRDDWLKRMRDEYPGVPEESYSATENFYDAIYWLAYGLYKYAPGAPATGESIKMGVRQLRTGPRVYPASFDLAFLAMRTQSNTTFIGALGPRDIDPGTGTQFGYGALYCYDPAAPSSNLASPKYDIRQYDRTTGLLVGTKPCSATFP